MTDFWLPWVFVAVCGLPLLVESWGYTSWWCAGFLLWWLLLLWNTGSRHMGSMVAAHRLTRPTARGIFLDQSLNPCPQYWQGDSYPLDHQGSPPLEFLMVVINSDASRNSILLFIFQFQRLPLCSCYTTALTIRWGNQCKVHSPTGPTVR